MAKLKKPTVKNPQLVEALAELKEHNTQGAAKNLMETLKGAQLIAPVIIDNMPEDLDLSDGKQFQTNAKFTMLQQKDGSRYFPAFTDWLEVLKWRNDPEINTVVMTVEQYANLMQRSGEASGIVINPSEQGYLIDRPHLAQLTGLTLPPAASEYRNEPLPEPTLNPKVAFADASTLSNPQLVGAIAAFRKKSTQETELPMIDALFRSQVIAPVQLINAEQDLNMEDGEKHQTQIKFVMVQNNDKKFFPAFTDMEELNRWKNPPEYRTMIIPFLQYAAMFQQNGDAEGIVVNPFREGESVAMPKANVIDLAKRFVHYQRQQQQNRVQLFDLKDKPIDLMKELSAHFEEVPEVHAAYMTGMRVGNKESVMLVLDCDQVEDTKSLFQPAAQIVNRHTNGNTPGIITTQHDMSKSILERTRPFYQE